MLIIGVTVVLVLAAALTTTHLVVGRSYVALENAQVTEQMRRAVGSIATEVASLDRTVHAWAARDISYALCQEGKAAFLEADLIDAAFQTNRLNLIAYLDTDGVILFAAGFNLVTGRRSELDPVLRRLLESSSGLTHHVVVNDVVKGLVMVGGIPMLVSSRPITSSDRTGPICGTLVMGRTLQGPLLDRLAATTHLDLHGPDGVAVPPAVRQRLAASTEAIPIVIEPLGPDQITGFATIRNVAGNGLVILRSVLPREIYDRGRLAMTCLTVTFVIGAIIYGVMLTLLLERRVVHRPARWGRQVAAVVTADSVTALPTDPEHDELSNLSNAVSKMMDWITACVRKRWATTARATDHLAAMDAAMEGIAILNTEGRYVYLNAAYAVIFGHRDPSELVNCSWRAQFDDAEASRLDDAAFIPLATAGRWRGDGRGQRPDGNIVEIDLSLTSLPEKGIICICRDVTEVNRARRERELLEMELRQSQKLEAVGTLASGVAHEFNNILTSILGFTDLTRKALPRDHLAQKTLDKVESASHHAAHVTGSLLTFTYKDHADRTPVDLRDVMHDAVAMLQPVLPTSIELEVKIPGESIWSEADGCLIQQVLVNLTVNARDAMEDGGRLQLTLQSSGANTSECVIVVKDTGAGMADDVQNRLFEPFFTTKPRGHGSGLGLAVVHGIVRDHGGSIQVDSDPGRGTAITVTLPRISAPAETALA